MHLPPSRKSWQPPEPTPASDSQTTPKPQETLTHQFLLAAATFSYTLSRDSTCRNSKFAGSGLDSWTYLAAYHNLVKPEFPIETSRLCFIDFSCPGHIEFATRAGPSEITRLPATADRPSLRRCARCPDDLQGSIERELKGLIFFLTHWVCTSKASSPRLDSHKY
jgi:hypothetical protein